MDIWGRTSPSAMPFTQHGYNPSIDEELVGFDNDAKNIIEKLVGGTREMDVVSIVGMAGQGKTALARKVYNNPSIDDVISEQQKYSSESEERSIEAKPLY